MWFLTKGFTQDDIKRATLSLRDSKIMKKEYHDKFWAQENDDILSYLTESSPLVEKELFIEEVLDKNEDFDEVKKAAFFANDLLVRSKFEIGDGYDARVFYPYDFLLSLYAKYDQDYWIQLAFSGVAD